MSYLGIDGGGTRVKMGLVDNDGNITKFQEFIVLGSRLGKRAYSEADLEFGAGLVAQAGVFVLIKQTRLKKIFGKP